MGSSDTERTPALKNYIVYRGKIAEYLKSATIFGKVYYDIRLPNGMVKTVPASMCKKSERKENE